MRTDRLMSLLFRLQNAGLVKVEILAQEFGVSRRTILRDAESLSLAGVPVYTQPGPGGGLALLAGYRLSLANLNEDELRAVYLSGNLRKLADLGMQTAAENVLTKIGASLPPEQYAAVERTRQRIYIDSNWWVEDGPPALLRSILQAVNEDRCLDAMYAASGQEPRRRQLEAYGLVSKGGTWYLVARRNGEFRTYRVSRFQEVQVLEQRFARQAGFDLQGYWRSSVDTLMQSLLRYRYTLRIRQEQQDFVRRYATGSLEALTPAQDGWYTAEFVAEEREAALMLVMGLGLDAEVLAPDDLRQAVFARAAEIHSHAQIDIG